MFGCCSGRASFNLGGGGSGPPGGVTTFNGRSGAVVSANSDYNTTQVDNASGVAGATCTAALNQLNSDLAAVVAGLAGLDSDDIANVSDVSGADVTAALNTLGLGALKRGPDLSGTVNTTLERATGTVFVMLPAVMTAPRTLTLEDSGAVAPVYPFNFVTMIYPQGHALTFVSGPNALTLFTLPSGQGCLLYWQFDGINFYPAGFGDLA